MNARSTINRWSLIMLLILLGGILFASDVQSTYKEKDGWLLFYLSWEDITSKRFLGKSITVNGEEGNRTVTYNQHKLSCGTLMTGTLKETTKGSIIELKGSFTVAANPYKITSMGIEFTKQPADRLWNGTMVIDGSPVVASIARGY